MAPCPPCRGTGKVISTEGGAAKTVTCPWCGGSGERRPPVSSDAD
jgi:DnaJ-class molecular chaperone